MEITFSQTKNVSNIEKHDASLAEAVRFEWNETVMWCDQRHEYGEHRIIGLGYIGDRLFNVVFVDRNEERRIISLLRANPREVKRYAEA